MEVLVVGFHAVTVDYNSLYLVIAKTFGSGDCLGDKKSSHFLYRNFYFF